ncbi:uncharacterized protein METZ01_LOCUS299886, partial [marine metagenome]
MDFLNQFIILVEIDWTLVFLSISLILILISYFILLKDYMTKNENSSLKDKEIGVLSVDLSSSRGKCVGTLNLSFEEKIRRDREAFR